MAKGGRAAFGINFSAFERNLNVAINRVERGTKKATRAAAEEILAESINQVPKDTHNLENSAYYTIEGRYRNFGAEIGYGGNNDPINPKSGESASSYMVAVHEDLEATHLNGKAKFLEDPVREYQTKYGAKAARIIREELGG